MLKNNNGEVNYDGVMNETPYLFQVIIEAIRMYPVVPWIDRECTDPNGYSLEPYSNFRIPYKMQLYMPAFPLHRDEKFFPDSLKFNPDRFSAENRQNLPQCSFIGKSVIEKEFLDGFLFSSFNFISYFFRFWSR